GRATTAEDRIDVRGDGAVQQVGRFRTRRESDEIAILIQDHGRFGSVHFEKNDRRTVVERLRYGDSAQDTIPPQVDGRAGGIDSEVGDIAGNRNVIAVKPKLPVVLLVVEFAQP